MDVKHAIGTAKAYVMDVFADAQVEELELEETEFDAAEDRWRIALSFSGRAHRRRAWFMVRAGSGLRFSMCD